MKKIFNVFFSTIKLPKFKFDHLFIEEFWFDFIFLIILVFWGWFQLDFLLLKTLCDFFSEKSKDYKELRYRKTSTVPQESKEKINTTKSIPMQNFKGFRFLDVLHMQNNV